MACKLRLISVRNFPASAATGLLHISINLGIPFLNQVIIAFVGAVILLLVWRLVFGRRK